MTDQNTSPTDLARQIGTFHKVRTRNPKHNLWFFDSPKNDRRLTLVGDLSFYLCVLLEGDTNVISYHPDEAAANEATRRIQVNLHGGVNLAWGVRRKNTRPVSDPPNETRAGSGECAVAVWKTDDDIRGQEIAIDNWLLLCAAITRCRNSSMQRESDAMLNCMSKLRSMQIGELLVQPEIDPAIMLAVIASAIQRGIVHCDLKNNLLTLRTVVDWRGNR